MFRRRKFGYPRQRMAAAARLYGSPEIIIVVRASSRDGMRCIRPVAFRCYKYCSLVCRTLRDSPLGYMAH